MANNWSELVGEVVDAKYVLQRMESEQEYRAVFLAEDAVDGSHVLVELVTANSPDFEVQQRRWSIASDLSHDHLVKIYSSGIVSVNGDQVLYCARERHDECLADVLASRTLEESEASPVLQSVLSCLAYLHGRGLAHGDIRPENVLAVGDRIKLTAGSITAAAGAAPEDMYGAGELISGMFGGGKAPRPLRDIAAGCLRPDPDERPTAPDALRMLSPQAASAAASPEPARAGASSSSKGRIAIAAGLAIAAVLAAAAFLRSRPQERAAVSPPPVLEDTRPSPIRSADPDPIDRSRAAAPKPAVTEVPKSMRPPTQDTGATWAVIAATYRDYDAAERRANSIGRQFKDCNCSVFPERGKGVKYYVVLGSGMTHDAAERVRQRAANSGAPGDTYVTKLNVDEVRSRANDEVR
jgi:hypothetical protein